MRQRSQQIPASPHAPQRTSRGATCDSVVRDQARDVLFRPTRTTKNVNVPSDKEGGNPPVAHLDKRHFRNRDSYAIVRVAPSGIEELPLVRLRGHRLNQAQDQYSPQSRSLSLYGGSSCKLGITGDWKKDIWPRDLALGAGGPGIGTGDIGGLPVPVDDGWGWGGGE